MKVEFDGPYKPDAYSPDRGYLWSAWSGPFVPEITKMYGRELTPSEIMCIHRYGLRLIDWLEADYSHCEEVL